MRFSASALVLATLAIGESSAFAPHRHAIRHAHTLKRSTPQVEAPIEKRAPSLLADVSVSHLATLGAKAGLNPTSNTGGGIWIGTDGDYTNEFTNVSGEPLILVIWGSAGSWINSIVPQVTATLANGTSQTVSFASGVSGAWSTIFTDTELVDGQISNTWGEFTTGEYGVIDVSREVNMNGHDMEVVLPECTTNMNTCVFVCPSSTSCMTGYQLLNCENGSQAGATYGTYDGAPSGGCGGMGSSASFKTTLS